MYMYIYIYVYVDINEVCVWCVLCVLYVETSTGIFFC